MNDLSSRIYLQQMQSDEPTVFFINDVLDHKNIGTLSLRSNHLEALKIKSKSQNKYIATEAILLLIKHFKKDIKCKVPNEDTKSIKLLSTFSDTIEAGPDTIFEIKYKRYKNMSWKNLYLNKIHQKNYITYATNHILINLSSRLKYAGKDMFKRDYWLHPTALKAWKKMKSKAQEEDIELQAVSGFRSLDYQNRLIANKISKGIALEDILKVNTLAGYSEHHSGCAIDIASPGSIILETEFDKSDAFKWLVSNANKFNFYLSYPKDNALGIMYEPWHWCYHFKSDKPKIS